MRISEDVINHIKRENKIKLAFCEAMDVHFLSVERWFNQNKENGPLTTAKALQIIKAHTAFTDADILTDETVSA